MKKRKIYAIKKSQGCHTGLDIFGFISPGTRMMKHPVFSGWDVIWFLDSCSLLIFIIRYKQYSWVSNKWRILSIRIPMNLRYVCSNLLHKLFLNMNSQFLLTPGILAYCVGYIPLFWKLYCSSFDLWVPALVFTPGLHSIACNPN